MSRLIEGSTTTVKVEKVSFLSARHFDGCHFLTKIEEEERGERRQKGFIVYYSVVSGFFFDVLVSEEATRSKG